MRRTWQTLRASGAADLRDGRDLVLRVSAATGLPDPDVWPTALLEAHTRARQEAAETVRLARAPDGICIGHALAGRAAEGSTVAGIPELAAAAERGLLFELGAVAVDPERQGLGVAAALVEACSGDVMRNHPEAMLVAAVWPDGPSAAWAERRWVSVGASLSPKGQTVRVFRRP